MRTTIDLADDVLAAASELARVQQRSLGEVISTLCRAGLRAASVEVVDGIPVIRARPDAPVLTSEAVRRALAE